MMQLRQFAVRQTLLTKKVSAKADRDPAAQGQSDSALGAHLFPPSGSRPPLQVVGRFIDEYRHAYGVEPIRRMTHAAPSADVGLAFAQFDRRAQQCGGSKLVTGVSSQHNLHQIISQARVDQEHLVWLHERDPISKHADMQIRAPLETDYAIRGHDGNQFPILEVRRRSE